MTYFQSIRTVIVDESSIRSLLLERGMRFACLGTMERVTFAFFWGRLGTTVAARVEALACSAVLLGAFTGEVLCGVVEGRKGGGSRGDGGVVWGREY